MTGIVGVLIVLALIFLLLHAIGKIPSWSWGLILLLIVIVDKGLGLFR